MDEEGRYTVLCDSTIIASSDDLDEMIEVAKGIWEAKAKECNDAEKDVHREVYVCIMDNVDLVEVWDDEKDYTEEQGKTHYDPPKPKYSFGYDDWFEMNFGGGRNADIANKFNQNGGSRLGAKAVDAEIVDDNSGKADINKDIRYYGTPPFSWQIKNPINQKIIQQAPADFKDQHQCEVNGGYYAKRAAQRTAEGKVELEILDRQGNVIDTLEVDQNGFV